MTILKGKGFILRPARISDAKNIYEYQQDKDTIKNFMSVPKSLNEAKNEIKEGLKKHKDKIGEQFVIDVNNEAVGAISIWAKDKYNLTKAKISYWIAPKFRGKGIMTKIVKIVTNYAFKKYKFIRIFGNVRTFNKGSARVLEKAGYKLEGILRKDAFKNGKYYDNMVWAKVK